MNLQTTGLPGGIIAEQPGQTMLLPLGTLTTQLIEADFNMARTSNKQLAFPTPLQNGTSVDFAQMCQWEGGNLAVAYNDGSNNITVGCGFNISGMTSGELNQLSQIDPGFAQALAPYVGLSVYQAAANGLPDFAITQQQSNELAQLFFTQDMSYVQAQIPQFSSMTPTEQTVVFDMYWNSGSNVYNYNGGAVKNDINNGSWTALGNLLEDSAYWPSNLDPSRRYAEGSYLITSL